MRTLWFSSSQFSLIPGEEEKTNPGCFGEALANWLSGRLAEAGHQLETQPIPEDWGWVVMVQRKPFSLWVGCRNESASTTRWGLFVEAESGFFQRLLGRVDPSRAVQDLEKELERIVKTADVQDVEWENL